MTSERKRQTLNAEMVIPASPEKIFPLLCPVREFDWIPGWQCRILFSASGFAELGCVFSTDFNDDFGEEVWVVSHYQPKRQICFVRTGARRSTRYSITLTNEAEKTRLAWEQEMTGLDDMGDKLVSGFNPSIFKKQIGHLEQLLTFYLLHGEAKTPSR